MLEFLLKYHTVMRITTHKNQQELRKDFFKIFMFELKKGYFRDIQQTKTTVYFKGPICRFTWNGWNLFNPVTEGKLRISLQGSIPKISYELYFKEFFVIALAMSLTSIPAFVLFSPIAGIIALIGVWLAFYLAARIITVVRLNSFIKDTFHKLNYPNDKVFDLLAYLREDIEFAEEIFSSPDVIAVG